MKSPVNVLKVLISGGLLACDRREIQDLLACRRSVTRLPIRILRLLPPYIRRSWGNAGGRGECGRGCADPLTAVGARAASSARQPRLHHFYGRVPVTMRAWMFIKASDAFGGPAPPVATARGGAQRPSNRRYLMGWSTLGIALTTLACLPLLGWLDLANIVLLFVLAIVFIASRLWPRAGRAECIVPGRGLFRFLFCSSAVFFYGRSRSIPRDLCW